jgi:hypothetical protein
MEKREIFGDVFMMLNSEMKIERSSFSNLDHFRAIYMASSSSLLDSNLIEIHSTHFTNCMSPTGGALYLEN